jgi:hypothetical protein
VAYGVTDRRTRGKPNAHLCIPDAVLHYTRCWASGQELLVRFVELDRGGETVARLMEKLRTYARLRDYRPRGDLPGWRSQFLAFPKVLVVLAGRTPAAMASRRDTLLRLCEIDPLMTRVASLDLDPVVVMVTTLPELVARGPFAAIFWTANADQPVDVTGELAG